MENRRLAESFGKVISVRARSRRGTAASAVPASAEISNLRRGSTMTLTRNRRRQNACHATTLSFLPPVDDRQTPHLAPDTLTLRDASPLMQVNQWTGVAKRKCIGSEVGRL